MPCVDYFDNLNALLCLDTKDELIKILVKNLSTEEELLVDLKPTDQISELKRRIYRQWRIDPTKQQLFIAPMEKLSDERTLQDYRIEEKTPIFLDPPV